MIDLPDLSQGFVWENNFYLSCSPARIGKMMAHYELFKLSLDVPGALVECGTFKGASLARFACFRDLLENASARQIIAFDSFGAFPPTAFAADKAKLAEFIRAAGDQSIGTDQLMSVLAHKRCEGNVELVAGDICQTVPQYVAEHPQLTISMLNLDTDVYEPAIVILEHLYPRLQRGGVLILDDYGVFPGETAAVDEYFGDRRPEIRRFPFAATPCFIVKDT
jgi:hypothetical protein